MTKSIAGRSWAIIAFVPSRGKRVTCRLFNAWDNMHKRCKGWKLYERSYGSKGIKVCYAWREYATFRAWAVTNGFRKGMTLDRIDNNSGYDPSNCRWIPKGWQQDNTRRTKMLTVDGVTKPLPMWCRELGLDPRLIRGRLKCGWSHERALGFDRA